MQGFHHFCTALSFPGKVPYSVRLRCKSAGDLRVFSCQALSLVGPPKISSRRKQRRRCFRWPQACTKEKESQGDRGINPVLTLVLCRESPFTLFGFCASHNARRCSEAWRMILCYVLGVSHTPILLYFLISSPYHLQRVAFPTVVKFLLDICQKPGRRRLSSKNAQTELHRQDPQNRRVDLLLRDLPALYRRQHSGHLGLKVRAAEQVVSGLYR